MDSSWTGLPENSAESLKLQQCLGFAVLDGNLKRKTFGDGNFFIVNQAEIEAGHLQNVLSKYQSLDKAKSQFKMIDISKDSQGTRSAKILVDGATGKILDQSGDARLVAQNLMYMYQHVQGTVFNGRYLGQEQVR